MAESVREVSDGDSTTSETTYLSDNEEAKVPIECSIGSDIRRVREIVNSLLQDKWLMGRMSQLDHLSWAEGLPSCGEEIDLPVLIEEALDECSGLDERQVLARRLEAKTFWMERKRVLDLEWAAVFRRLPAHVQSVLGPKKNLLLLREMLAASESPDVTLVENLMEGFPLVGELVRSGTLPRVAYESMRPLHELIDARELKNDSMLERVKASKVHDDEVQTAFDESVEKEIATGKAFEISVKQAREKAVITPRFAVDQGFKLKKRKRVRKVRAMDDFTASLINALTSVGEAIRHDSLDALVAIYRRLGRGSRKIRFRKEDFVAAFKTLPLKEEHLQLAVAAWLSGKGVRAVQLLAAPFGALSSVHSWHRVGAAVQRILARLFAIPHARYVDDLFGMDAECDSTSSEGMAAGPLGTTELARFVIEDLLGWELDKDKAVANAKKCIVLGVQAAVDDDAGCLVFTVDEAKMEKWIGLLLAARRSGELSPMQSRKLAGMLSWGASCVFGKGARVYLAPFFHHASRNSWKCAPRLLAAMDWWLGFLRALPERVVPLVPPVRRRSIIYSDATGQGDLAWVAKIGNTKMWWSSGFVAKELRQWVCKRKVQIASWELVAAVSAFWALLQDICAVYATEVHLIVDYLYEN